MSCWPITVVWYATMHVRHGDITCNIDDTSRESYSPMITTENCACHITVIGNTISEHNFQTVCGQVKRKSKSNAKYALCSILLLESLWRLRVKIPFFKFCIWFVKIPFFCPWHRQGGCRQVSWPITRGPQRTKASWDWFMTFLVVFSWRKIGKNQVVQK